MRVGHCRRVGGGAVGGGAAQVSSRGGNPVLRPLSCAPGNLLTYLTDREIESLNLARMAIDKKTENLSGNGVAVVLERGQQTFRVIDASGKEILRLEILEIQK